jgi:glycosyltransferase involved in cell wall biosynthesis
MKVSCIIPAYNEGPRIKSVLDVIGNCPSVDEIIVINDASTDNTREILEKYTNITLINQEINQGKTKAVLLGLKKSKNDLVVTIDADLLGLSIETVESLISPVVEGKVGMTISLRSNSLSTYKMLGIDFVSGERVFNKNILLSKEDELVALPNFGLEVFMNEQIINSNLPIQVVIWDKVISPRKFDKMGFLLGSLGDLKMIQQILATVSLQKCVRQIIALRKLARH